MMLGFIECHACAQVGVDVRLHMRVELVGQVAVAPTKTEQADLLQAVFGRNGECPVAIIAASSPSDCFYAAIEAFTIATKYMTPVILMSDGYIANSSSKSASV